MYKAYSEETAHSINGVPGRLYARHVCPDRPDLFSAQKWISEGRASKEARNYGSNARLHAEIRFDDQCKNGRSSFSITATISGAKSYHDNGSIGCHHEAIAKAFPELAHLIRWHLCATDGPMHYVANTVYLAGDRDHNGLRAGESRQLVNGRTGLPCWQLEADGAPLHHVEKTFEGLEADLPPVPVMRWAPWLIIGEGKARDLAAARRSAVWPDATDAQLCAEKADLAAMLEARLPKLMAEFRADMDEAGLLWEPQA